MITTFSECARRIEVFLRASLDPTPPAGAVPDSFDALARALFRLQYEHVPPYRRYCDRLGLGPAQIDGGAEIPAVPTDAFKEFDLSSLAPGIRTVEFRSSGSTGQTPSRHPHDPASLSLYALSSGSWFARHVVPEGRRLRVLSLTPPPSEAPHSSLAHMAEVVLKNHGTPGSGYHAHPGDAGDWQVDAPGLAAALDDATRVDEPTLLFSTAFGCVHFLEWLESEKRSLRLPAGSRLMETGGYKGRSRSLPRSELHAGLGRRLGLAAAAVVGEYGMTELGSQAYDGVVGREGPRRFRFPPWARAWVVSPETGRPVPPGDPGLVRVFDLANVRSVLAVQTADLAVAHDDGLELIGRAPLAAARGCSLLHA